MQVEVIIRDERQHNDSLNQRARLPSEILPPRRTRTRSYVAQRTGAAFGYRLCRRRLVWGACGIGGRHHQNMRRDFDRPATLLSGSLRAQCPSEKVRPEGCVHLAGESPSRAMIGWPGNWQETWLGNWLGLRG